MVGGGWEQKWKGLSLHENIHECYRDDLVNAEIVDGKLPRHLRYLVLKTGGVAGTVGEGIESI